MNRSCCTRKLTFKVVGSKVDDLEFIQIGQKFDAICALKQKRKVLCSREVTNFLVKCSLILHIFFILLLKVCFHAL